MEEKILIKGNHSNIKWLVYFPILLIVPILALLIFIWMLEEFDNTYLIRFNFEMFHTVFTLTTTILSLIAFYIYYLICKKGKPWYNLTVTDCRVYGKIPGKQVDLPIDSISSVGTSRFKGISIGTSSGRINFKFVKNQLEIHETISKLLRERNNKSTAKTESPAPINPTTTTEELKGLKELLDAGIITQDEFNAKKKQVLGL